MEPEQAPRKSGRNARKRSLNVKSLAQAALSYCFTAADIQRNVVFAQLIFSAENRQRRQATQKMRVQSRRQLRSSSEFSVMFRDAFSILQRLARYRVFIPASAGTVASVLRVIQTVRTNHSLARRHQSAGSACVAARADVGAHIVIFWLQLQGHLRQQNAFANGLILASSRFNAMLFPR